MIPVEIASKFGKKLVGPVLIIVVTLFTTSCSSSVVAPVQNAGIVATPTASPAKTPAKSTSEPPTVFDRLFDRFGEDETRPLRIDGYTVRIVKKLRKQDGEGPVEIRDAQLVRNGKRVMEFRGEFNPLGNSMVFDKADLTGDGRDELIVVDDSGGGTRDWIVAMRPTPHVIFDSRDYDLWYPGVDSLDVDGDGVQELVGHVEDGLGFGTSRGDSGQPRILFRFARATGEYLPAGRTLPPPERMVDSRPGKDFLSRFGDLAFAGREDEAWEHFEREWRNDFDGLYMSGERNKENARRHLADWLATDKTYRKVKKITDRYPKSS